MRPLKKRIRVLGRTEEISVHLDRSFLEAAELDQCIDETEPRLREIRLQREGPGNAFDRLFSAPSPAQQRAQIVVGEHKVRREFQGVAISGFGLFDAPEGLERPRAVEVEPGVGGSKNKRRRVMPDRVFRTT